MVIHAGYLWQQTVSNSPLFAGKHRTRNMAPYVQMEWTPHSRLTLEIGGRYEAWKMDESRASRPVFRSGLNYQLARHSFLRASYGQGFRFPTIAESFIETKVGAISIYPNPELQAERGWNAEIGIKQGFRAGKLKLIADLSAFWMEYHDMMEFIFAQWSTDARIENGLGFGFKSLNVGHNRITGIDLNVLFERKFPGGHSIEGLLAYTYSRPESLDPDKVFAVNAFGKDLSFSNTSSNPENHQLKYRYKHLAKAEVRYTEGRFDMATNLRYNSYIENIDLAFLEFPINLLVKGIADAREADQKGKVFVDLRFGYTLKKKYRIGLSATNIFRSHQMNRPADITGPGSILIQMRAKI
jgi:iron complex outermembrane receptor protein